MATGSPMVTSTVIDRGQSRCTSTSITPGNRVRARRMSPTGTRTIDPVPATSSAVSCTAAVSLPV